MADLQDVLIFCALYSGVVLSSLVLTVSQKVVKVRSSRKF